MPASYQAPRKSDNKNNRTSSQSTQTNLATSSTKVKNIIANKGDAIYSVRPQDTLLRTVELLGEKGIGALVVTDEKGELQGIISERDIVRRLAKDPDCLKQCKVNDVMTKNVETSDADEALVSVLRRMTNGRFRHMPVMEGSKLKGMITIGDVVNHRLNELEHEALQLKQLVVG